MSSDDTEKVEYLTRGRIPAACPLVISCEHAGHLVPPPVVPTCDDQRWLTCHWGYDIGAAQVAAELSRITESALVMANFSRLLCDTNRPWTSPGCILLEIEGEPLSMNAGIDAAERERRRRTLYEPYHAAVEETLARRCRELPKPLLLSIHSFTPVLGSDRRWMQIGVLFDDHEALARALAARLSAVGFVTALNAPYSGKEGLIYSVTRHGRAHAVPYLEIEIRQDMIRRPEDAVSVARRLRDPVLALVASW